MQARGMSLVEIQANLAGADDQSLSRWAALPERFWQAELEQPAARAMSPSSEERLASPPAPMERPGRGRFWAEAPAVAARDARVRVAAAMDPQPAIVLPLGSGVSLVIAGRSSERLDEGVLTAIRPALEKLVAAMTSAGILENPGRPADHRHTSNNQGDNHGP
jgi:hypothetical protein